LTESTRNRQREDRDLQIERVHSRSGISPGLVTGCVAFCREQLRQVDTRTLIAGQRRERRTE
jgi:hypothetical protein